MEPWHTLRETYLADMVRSLQQQLEVRMQEALQSPQPWVALVIGPLSSAADFDATPRGATYTLKQYVWKLEAADEAGLWHAYHAGHFDYYASRDPELRVTPFPLQSHVLLLRKNGINTFLKEKPH